MTFDAQSRLPIPLFYSPLYVAAGHGFDTTRKARWLHDSLLDAPIAGFEWRTPPPLDAARLARVHDHAYVDAVRLGRPLDLAESQGFAWDGGLWTSACAHTGGMVAAAHAALERGCAGSLSSGQHHARRDTGEGFCTFNGIALAARELAGAGKRVLIIDTDAHCAGGTHSLVEDDARISQMDIAVSAFDDYAPAPRHRTCASTTRAWTRSRTAAPAAWGASTRGCWPRASASSSTGAASAASRSPSALAAATPAGG
jgi:acetoin utilization deacetylase AcuC-like enzyme